MHLAFYHMSLGYNASQTSLMKAVDAGKIDDLKELLAKEVDVTQRDTWGDIALTKAVRKENEEMIGLLREAHAKQFYKEAQSAKSTQLQTLLNKHTADANISQKEVAKYLFEEANAESDHDQKILILDSAIPSISTTALSAYMNISNFWGQRKVLDSIEDTRKQWLPFDDKSLSATVMLKIKK